MKTTNSVFVADPEGFREQNSGRPPADLVREAVQNALDEAATCIDVELSFAGTGVRFRIADDVPGGIRDESLVWTIWKSDKQDSPNKRGRMGRGLKELISVSDDTLIVTAGGPATHFSRVRGKWERSSPRKVRPKAGTVVEGFVRAWSKRDMLEIDHQLRRFRPPEHITLTVRGVCVERAPATETYLIELPTVFFEAREDGDRVERHPRQKTTVELFAKDGESWVYEMGIPVEEIDFPLSIDVGQRIPLREKRDTLTDPYRRELYAKILDARAKAGLLRADEMRDDHVLLAAQAPEHLSVETKRAIAQAWTLGRPYASTPEVARQATGQHIEVVPLRSLPESVRDLAREVGKNAKEVLDNMAVAACSTIPTTAYTAEQKTLVDVWEWIAQGINKSCTVKLSTGKPSAGATFRREARVLTVFVENMPGVMRRPLSAEALSILIHELAHWREQDEDSHGSGFHSDAEEVGGKVAAFIARSFVENSELIQTYKNLLEMKRSQ